ncbi:M81 family metallopeptidase [Pseudovibrio sp. Ad26]|uniref:M81 family metallopeptidase n=1 Tax=Pseudovibrio sp. Ad26 TaxID=989410 RepID=UPI0007AE5808|nr:M81 family metallopeptidase [Pseudovibrio sp. Ad26]KZL01875.1 hypothetical protein PsAD26_04742 [Pseudovibrio sp. Ad26]
MNAKPRVAIASFMHETNTFNPVKTPVSEFEKADSWPAATRGQDMLKTFCGMNIPTGGFISEGNDFELLPILWASAEPAGKVTSEAFDVYTEEVCDGLRGLLPLDGVLLDLHGAMVAEGFDDGEQEFLERIRSVVGNVPIVAALDFHANISADFVETCDAITIYREYPHIDMALTGVRATRILRQILNDNKPIEKSFLQLPFLIPLSAQATSIEPFATIYSGFDELNIEGLISVDAAAGFSSADVANAGPSVVAYAATKKAAEQATQIIFDRFMAARSSIGNNLLLPEDAIHKAAELIGQCPKPVILADVQDNPGAGASSDTTSILHSLVSLDAVPAIVGIIADTDCVAQAWEAGLGSFIKVALGGTAPIENETPLTATFEVVQLTDKPIACTGDMYAGCLADLGKMALLRITGLTNDIHIVVSEKRFQCVDLALLRSFGLLLEGPLIIVVKSTAHFRADFDPIAQMTILVKAPGLNPCVLNEVIYSKLRDSIQTS